MLPNLMKGLSSLDRLLRLEISGYGVFTYLPRYLCNILAQLNGEHPPYCCSKFALAS